MAFGSRWAGKGEANTHTHKWCKLRTTFFIQTFLQHLLLVLYTLFCQSKTPSANRGLIAPFCPRGLNALDVHYIHPKTAKLKTRPRVFTMGHSPTYKHQKDIVTPKFLQCARKLSHAFFGHTLQRYYCNRQSCKCLSHLSPASDRAGLPTACTRYSCVPWA